MKEAIVFVLVVFLIISVSAECTETQININSASLEELDKINGIGLVYAQRIIDNRPYNSLEDLIKVSGIGNKTLEKIKSQNLACVDGETSGQTNSEEETSQEQTQEQTEKIPEPVEEYFPEDFSMPKITANSINTQTIKTIDNEQKNSKMNFAVYGLAGFCLLLATLFAIKKFNRNRKNEFRE